jgi:hypothetical protein
LRCVPHDEDTGGFFVATLRKKPMASLASAVVVEPAGDKMTVESEAKVAPEEEEVIDVDVNQFANSDTADDDAGQDDDADGDDDDDNEDADASEQPATKKQKAASGCAAVAVSQGEAQVASGSAKTAEKGSQQQQSKHGLVEFKNWDLESFQKVTTGSNWAVSVNGISLRHTSAVICSAGERVLRTGRLLVTRLHVRPQRLWNPQRRRCGYSSKVRVLRSSQCLQVDARYRGQNQFHTSAVVVKDVTS